LPVVLGVIGRVGFGLAILAWATGFRVLGLVAIAFAVALYFVYHRMVISVLMSRP
jgi:hypothetical protein